MSVWPISSCSSRASRPRSFSWAVSARRPLLRRSSSSRSSIALNAFASRATSPSAPSSASRRPGDRGSTRSISAVSRSSGPKTRRSSSRLTEIMSAAPTPSTAASASLSRGLTLAGETASRTTAARMHARVDGDGALEQRHATSLARARGDGWAALPKPALRPRQPRGRGLWLALPMSQAPATETAAVQDTAARTAAPGVPVAAPAPGAGALGAFASGMGNASFSRGRSGGGSAIARTPAAAVAQPPRGRRHLGARPLGPAAAGRARRRGAGRHRARAPRPPTGRRARSPTTPPPIALRMGDQAISDHLAPDKPYAKELVTKFSAGSPQMLRLQTHLFPGVFVHFNAGVQRRGRRAGQHQPRAEPREGRGDDVRRLRHRVGQRRRERPARRVAQRGPRRRHPRGEREGARLRLAAS